MQFAQGRILVFAKAPEPGKVKTRLVPSMSAEASAALHKKLVAHTLKMATTANICPVELWCAPDSQHPFLQACGQQANVPLHTQRGANLGERMHNALADTLEQQEFAIVIGSDCPVMNRGHLEEACTALTKDTNPVVLIPALDGGYTLIGARRTDSRLFTAVEWGSGQVLARTLANLAALDWPGVQLEPLWDIDHPADLQRLQEEHPEIAATLI